MAPRPPRLSCNSACDPGDKGKRPGPVPSTHRPCRVTGCQDRQARGPEACLRRRWKKEERSLRPGWQWPRGTGGGGQGAGPQPEAGPHAASGQGHGALPAWPLAPVTGDSPLLQPLSLRRGCPRVRDVNRQKTRAWRGSGSFSVGTLLPRLCQMNFFQKLIRNLDF